jgi:hypothetical protein
MDGLYSGTILCFNVSFGNICSPPISKDIQIHLAKRKQYCQKAFLIGLVMVGKDRLEYLHLGLWLLT